MVLDRILLAILVGAAILRLGTLTIFLLCHRTDSVKQSAETWKADENKISKAFIFDKRVKSVDAAPNMETADLGIPPREKAQNCLSAFEGIIQHAPCSFFTNPTSLQIPISSE